MLRVGAGGKLNFAIGDGTWREITMANTILSLNTWQHIAGTYDGSMMRVYLDGAAVDSLSISITIANATSTNMLIGGHTTYVRYFQGMIDEVRVWNICRTKAELNNDMNNEFCTRPAGLRAYYKFNQGKASQNNPTVKKLTDLSAYGNTGTLGGFALVGSGSNWVKGKSLKKAVTNVNDTAVVCDKYFSASRKFTWTKSGVYTDTLPTAVMGCDSVITMYLTVKKSSAQTLYIYACNRYKSPSGLYTWTKNGIYTDKIPNKAKCDSIITINLKIGGSRDTSKVLTCNSYKIPGGKKTYTISGIFSDTLKGFAGCDSIMVTKLTIYKSSTSNINKKVCHPYISPSGKYTYKQTGNYVDTIKNYHGCDSFIGIHVQLMNSSSSVKPTVCNVYNSPSGRYKWTQSGLYADTVVNTFGCDSVIGIDLKVIKSSFVTIPATACRRYVSPSKKHVWSATGKYTDTIPNHAGCDSVMTINLDIKTVDIAVNQNGGELTAVNASATYQWLDCNKGMAIIPGETGRVFMAKAKGDYAVVVTEGNCRDSSDCYNVATISDINKVQNQGFKLMPNPGNGTFDLVLPFDCSHAVIHILDISGRMVYEQTYNTLKEAHIDLNELPGLYFIHIESEGYSSVQYLLLQP